MPPRHAPALAAVLVSCSLLAGSCAYTRTARPSVDAAAEDFAEALDALDMSEVDFAGEVTAEQVTEELAAIVAGMGEADPQVSVASVAEEGNTATATFDVAWPISRNDGGDRDPDAVWTYQSSVQLALVDGSWAATWAPSTIEPSLSAGERLERRRLAPRRSDVVGAGGTPLVTLRPVRRVGIDKTKIEVGQVPASAEALAELLALEDAAAFRERTVAAGEQAFVEAIVLREADAAAMDQARLQSIPGAVSIEDELPLAPTRVFARPILGTAGPVTAELIEASGGRLVEGDIAGLSGLQLTHDQRLRGRAGVVVQAAPQDGTTGQVRELFRREPVDGEPVHTTLDAGVQMLAEEVLALVGPASALVAIRPSTGEVLAAASGPGSDGFPTSTLGQYAPGSTFKVVTALALLRAGLTPDSELECSATTTVDGRAFKNYDDYPSAQLGPITLRSALAHSCNTALIAEQSRITQEALTDAAAALGLGALAPLGVPYFEGSVPSDAGAVGHGASMIGQDRILASPLAMAVVAASVATGEPLRPSLVTVPADSGTAPTPIDQPITATEAEQLRSMMRATVTEGSAQFLADVPGPHVLAKTGTAEYGPDTPPRTHAWMIAVRGDLAVSVFVEDGPGGARTAGPILQSFLRRVTVE